MAKSSHSPPSSREPTLHRLSQAATSSERPIRAQAVVTFAAVLALVAVPLYVLRRPGTSSLAPIADAGAPGFGGVIRTEADAARELTDVVLGPVQRVRCGTSATQTTGEGGLCDALPMLEGALREAIQSNVDCAPRTGKEGSINYVLEVDFASSRLNMFAGQSGTWRGSRGKKAATCVLRSLPPLPWTELPHQYQYYAIAIMASYPAPELGEGLPAFD